MRLVLLMLTFGLLAASVAEANEQRIPYPPQLGTRIQSCEGYPDGTACAHGDGWIDVPKGTGPSTWLHEVAHEFDYQILNDTHRAKVMSLLGLSGEWWGTERSLHPDGSINHAYAPPAEKFAEAYALCASQALGRRMLGWFEYGRRGHAVRVVSPSYGYRTTYRRHRRICQVIWSAGGMEWTVARPRLPEHLRGLWWA